jgi:hypothetical protein
MGRSGPRERLGARSEEHQECRVDAGVFSPTHWTQAFLLWPPMQGKCAFSVVLHVVSIRCGIGHVILLLGLMRPHVAFTLLVTHITVHIPPPAIFLAPAIHGQGPSFISCDPEAGAPCLARACENDPKTEMRFKTNHAFFFRNTVPGMLLRAYAEASHCPLSDARLFLVSHCSPPWGGNLRGGFPSAAGQRDHTGTSSPMGGRGKASS